VSPSQSSANSNVSAALTKSMHDHWGLYLGEGIVLILLGLAAIVFPFIAGIVATVFLGWLFLIAGIVGLVSTLRGRQAPGFGWSLLSALVALVAGTVLLWNPLQSLVTLPSGLVILTYVLIAYFIADGILDDHPRHRPSPRAGGQMGVDSGKRRHRFDPRGYHHLRLARDARLGTRAARRDRLGVRRSLAHRHRAGGTQGGGSHVTRTAIRSTPPVIENSEPHCR